MLSLRASIVLCSSVLLVATAYSIAAITGTVPMSWPIFAAWLLALTVTTLFLVQGLRRVWPKLSFNQQVTSILWVGIALWYWTIGPFYFGVAMNLDTLQLAWTAFAFFWEVPVVGGGTFVLFSILLLRPIARYAATQKTTAPAALYRTTFRYPWLVAMWLFVVSVLGYLIGAWQIRVFAAWPLVEQVKNIFNGAVVALFLSLLFYLILDNRLNRLREQLERQFPATAWPMRSVRARLTGVTAAVLAGNLGLIGLLLFDVGQHLSAQAAAGQPLSLTNLSVVGAIVSGLLLVSVMTLGALVFAAYSITRNLLLLRHTVTSPPYPLSTSSPASFYTGDEVETLYHAFQERLAALATERAELSQANIRTRAIFDSMGEGLIVTDTHERITMMNATAEKLLGHSSSAALGASFSTFIPTLDAHQALVPPEAHPLRHVLQGSKQVTSETYLFTRATQATFPVALTITPLHFQDEVLGTIVVFRDITAMHEADQIKREFVSIASHQLRTPLTAINWYVELLLSGRSGPLKPKQQRDMERIARGTTRMVRLVSNLLNVSRLESGRFVVTPAPTQLDAFITNLVEELSPQQKTLACEVSVAPAMQGTHVEIDQTLLRQVLQNLLVNAMKYQAPPRSCQVVVQVTTDADNIFLSIIDNGLGIPRAQQHRVFDRFFRADNITKVDTEGSGLGLYVCKTLLEAAGCHISFKSEEGQGTTFTITIPRQGMQARSAVL